MPDSEGISMIQSKVRDIIRKAFENCESIDQMGCDKELSSLGITSITFIKAIAAVEKEFDIGFDVEELLFENFNTVGKIVSAISEKLSSQ